MFPWSNSPSPGSFQQSLPPAPTPTPSLLQSLQLDYHEGDGDDDSTETATDLPLSDNERPAKKLKLSAGVEPCLSPSSLPSRHQTTPRRKPLYSFGHGGLLAGVKDSTESAGTIALEDSVGDCAAAAGLPPLPPRPFKCAVVVGENTTAESKKEPETEKPVLLPYQIEVPATAPKLAENSVADFHPWTGNHPEDALNDQTTKQGYYDRVQVSQNESNTARPSLYGKLKNRAGLQVLSAIFSAVIEKREANSHISCPSTFRPPPRVTLTDIKREAWLRDLANPTVPLRKLSRTIPHGLRGRVLLDHCLDKPIPIARAVWLAKCIGANEIRAFRRKGTSSSIATGLELKWVKEWTTNVQKFTESILNTCGDGQWTQKVSYVVRLSAHLFLDNLLDQDQFLEWYLTSLEKSSLDAIPVWILNTDIYWSSLIRYRTRARRFASCVLEKLQQALSLEQEDMFAPIIAVLSRVVRALAERAPSALVLPLVWKKYKQALTSCLGYENSIGKAILNALGSRNDQASRTSTQLGKSKPTLSQHLISLLDSSDLTLSALAADCLRMSSDYEFLVSKTLEWASTILRQGMSRVYLSARLFRKWKSAGIDTDSCILSFLRQDHKAGCLRLTDVYHVISELIRSQSFSVGKYLQWIMARGIASTTKISGPVPVEVDLLAHIPSSHLPGHMWNLRNTLLSRVGFSVSREETQIRQLKMHVRRRLSHIFPFVYGEDAEVTEDVDFSSLTWTVRMNIGQWIRDHVASHVQRSSNPPPGSDISHDIKVTALTSSEFFEIRHILEQLGDISMLADVLRQASISDDVAVLISAVDTFNYHYASFSSIGATDDLYTCFIEAYFRVDKTDSSIQELIISLLEVGGKLPSALSTVSTLRRDLAQLDKKMGLAVSSPVSDVMTDSLGSSPMFMGELDQPLSTGTSGDESTIFRFFQSLTKKLEMSKIEDQLSSSQAARCLAQTRTLNPGYFDNLMINWVVSSIRSLPRPSFSRVLPALIGVGCVTIESFMLLVMRLYSDLGQGPIPDATGLSIDLFHLLDPTIADDGAVDVVSYRFKMFRRDYMSKFASNILALIHLILSEVFKDSPQDAPAVNKVILPVLCELFVLHPSLMCENTPRLSEKFPACADVICQAASRLLGLSSTNSTEVAGEIVRQLNDFSLPLCAEKSRSLLKNDLDGESKRRIYDILFEATESSTHTSVSYCIAIVNVLDVEAAREIRQRAEEKLLFMFSESCKQDGSAIPNPEISSALYLRIVEELSFSIPEDGVPSFGGNLVEKMNMLLQKVICLVNNTRNTNGEVLDMPYILAYASQESSLTFWFHALLRLVTIHRSTCSFTTTLPTPTFKTELLDQTRLVLAICCIALSPLCSAQRHALCYAFGHGRSYPFSETSASVCPPYLSTPPTPPPTRLQTFAFDVAATLIDTIPDEARLHCARFLRDRCPPYLHPQNDHRLMFLLGPLSDLPVSGTGSGGGATVTAATAGSSTGCGNASVGYNGHGNGSSSQVPTPTTPSVAMSASASTSTAAPPTPVAVPAPAALACVNSIDDSSPLACRLRFQQGNVPLGSHPMRGWEMLEDAAPMVGVNDTAISLAYFNAKYAR